MFATALCGMSSTFGQPTSSADYLTGLKSRIEGIVRRAGLTTSISQAADGLTARCQTRVFQTYGHYKDRRAELAFPELGPADRGFMIEASLFDHKIGNKLEPEQAVSTNGQPFRTVRKGDFWFFEFHDLQIEGTEKAVHYRIAWGRNLAPKLLLNLKEAAAKGAKPLR